MKYIYLSLFIMLICVSGLRSQVVHQVCAGDTVELSVSVTPSDQVQWQQSVDGTSFFDIPGAVQSSHTIAGASQPRYYRSRITGQNCDPWYSEVRRVNVNYPPVLSITGLDASYCITSGPVTLNGNPSGGTFSGTAVTGNTFNPGQAGAGLFTITYHYTDTLGCSNIITANTGVVLQPSTANAGPNIVATATTITMAGNTPTNGTGQWSIATGTGGSFANANSPTTTFTGNPNTTYTLVWTISNLPCSPSTDTMTATMPAGSILPSVMCGSPAYTLYVHPTDNGTSAWGCSGITAGAADDNNGAANTATVVQVCGQATAAAVCDNLVAHGYSDWYLPSYNELECLRANATFIGGFSQGIYWSSTEGSGILYLNAKYRTFPTGTIGHGSKSSVYKLRCVRKD
jgi:Flp pilus assembly protein TadG